jgi:hypothetical protein
VPQSPYLWDISDSSWSAFVMVSLAFWRVSRRPAMNQARAALDGVQYGTVKL